MNKKDIINKAIERVETLAGIRAKWTDGPGEINGEIDLYIRDKDMHFYLEVKKEVRNHQLPGLLEHAKNYHPLMLIAEKIYPAVKEQLRKNKIPYLDTAGNIYVDQPGQFIWLDGNKPIEEKEAETNKAFTKTGLKVIFYLLRYPNAITLPYRMLAEAADVALGSLPAIIGGLKKGDFIIPLNDKTLKLKNKKQLLERWITGYAEILRPVLHWGTYRFWNETNRQNWQELILEKHDGLWGGEPAAEILTGYLKAATITVYAEEKHTVFRKWTLIPDNEGYILLYRKFWRDAPMNKNNHVPPLLVYADLMITDDPRCHETAQIIYNEYLKNVIE